MTTVNRFVWLLLVTAFATGCVAPQSGGTLTCGQDPHTHKLKFKLKADGCVESVLKDDGTDGSEVTVCRGDAVEWKVKLFTKQKSVAFDKGDGSPFDWSDSGFKGGKITGNVTAGAEAKSYGYTVRTKGPAGDCPLDPVIIVRY
jgi:hypothetical protein